MRRWTGRWLRAIAGRSGNCSSASGARACGWVWGWAMLTLAACSPTLPQVISATRDPERLPDGRYAVTEGWVQERYELERGLRWHLDQCRAREDADRSRTTGRGVLATATERAARDHGTQEHE